MSATWIRAVAGVALLATVASAAPDKEIDRDRLRKVPRLPPVGPSGWYYVVTTDGRVVAGGDEPAVASSAALRARIKGDDSDADRWLDVATACRREGDDAKAKEAAASAVAILKRLADAAPEDGRVRASLGLALAAAGDDEGADAAIAAATGAKEGAWSGLAASVDLLVARGVGDAAKRRFATLDDARDWLAASAERARSAATIARVADGAVKLYDEAVARAERDGATDRAAASVRIRRSLLRALARAASTKVGDGLHPMAIAQASEDHRKVLDALAPDPYALTLAALDDAMSEPTADGTTRVQSFQQLTPEARTKVTAELAKLSRVAASADGPTAARALEGIACVQWFCMGNPAVAESLLRRATAKDPNLASSWYALVLVLAGTQRFDDVAKLAREWLKSGETPRKRMILAKALAMTGRREEAEKEWRAALALDPSGAAENAGVAVLVLQRAASEEHDREAAKLAAVAADALRAAGERTDRSLALSCDVLSAATLALTGDADGAEAIARRLLERPDAVSPASEVLAAIGR